MLVPCYLPLYIWHNNNSERGITLSILFVYFNVGHLYLGLIATPYLGIPIVHVKSFEGEKYCCFQFYENCKSLTWTSYSYCWIEHSLCTWCCKREGFHILNFQVMYLWSSSSLKLFTYTVYTSTSAAFWYDWVKNNSVIAYLIVLDQK